MRVRTKLSLGATAALSCALAAFSVSSKQQELPAERIAPTTWDDDILATLEVPLANPIGSPKQVPSTYYYKIPVRPIYKSYPVYAPGHEPPGYIDRLKQQEPVVLWDEKSHTPPLKTDSDWTKAGEMVFDSPVTSGQIGGRLPEGLYVRDPEFYRKTGTPVAADGTVPFYRYLVFEKGKVEIGILGCGMCHTRVMPDGSILKGAQGNFPFDRAFAYNYRKGGDYPDLARNLERLLYAAPWVRPDPQAGLEKMSIEEIASLHDRIPPGVLARHRAGPLYPVQVPDLIGVKDRLYLDRTGLQQNRSIEDIMRYAALNQGGDDLASYDGFIPADYPQFKKLPEPDHVNERYSDPQLYALALYIYSLRPPPNPNKFDNLAAQGKEVFERERCGRCHTPPLYSNNFLTPVDGFTPSPIAANLYNVSLTSVHTDPGLALNTRRGTGYYKVPSLRGVWYRGMFGHSGWCATLEDWFNPRRTHDDYVPTGFKPYGTKTYAVKGHPFGLELSEEDRKALIAFLRTL